MYYIFTYKVHIWSQRQSSAAIPFIAAMAFW